jgi:hypothetical protein
MRRTTPSREKKQPQSQYRLKLAEAGEPAFEAKTITRYRVALLRLASLDLGSNARGRAPCAPVDAGQSQT